MSESHIWIFLGSANVSPFSRGTVARIQARIVKLAVDSKWPLISGCFLNHNGSFFTFVSNLTNTGSETDHILLKILNPGQRWDYLSSDTKHVTLLFSLWVFFSDIWEEPLHDIWHQVRETERWVGEKRVFFFFFSVLSQAECEVMECKTYFKDEALINDCHEGEEHFSQWMPLIHFSHEFHQF